MSKKCVILLHIAILVTHTDSYWLILLHSTSLTPSDSFWLILTHSDSVWLIWSHLESFWLTLTHYMPPFPLTHSVSLMYINPVNYLWALQLNLLYSWCNTELFTWAFGTEPGLNSTFYLEVSFDLLDSEPAYTRLNTTGNEAREYLRVTRKCARVSICMLCPN